MKPFFVVAVLGLFLNFVSGVSCPVPATASDINDGDLALCIVSSALVLFMTPGLAFFYGGLVRKKNVVNTLMMSYAAMGVIVIQWCLFGYSFSFGPGNEGFGSFKWGGFRYVGSVPNADYAATIPHAAYANFQMMFAIITPALISGGVVERMHFRSWLLFIVIWSTVVYDPLAHWMWSANSIWHDDGTCEYQEGWLRKLGSVDFAGGTVIHISAGFSALIASYIVGKRTGYDPKQPVAPGNVPFVLIGAGILWFGWIGFNGGSALSKNALSGVAAINTSFSAASGFMTWTVCDTISSKRPSAVGAVTGAVIGMVAITPGSGYVYPGFALLFGVISVAIVYPAIRFKRIFRVDDSLDVFFCHGIGGVVGALLTGLFATKEIDPTGHDGAFYGNGELFGLQLLAVVVTIALSTVATAVILLVFKYTPIGLRTNEKWEEDGMDASVHQEAGVNDEDFAMEKMKAALGRTSSKPVSEDDSAIEKMKAAFGRTSNPVPSIREETPDSDVELHRRTSSGEN